MGNSIAVWSFRLFLPAALCMAIPAAAQTVTGTISGRVTDMSGGVIAGAQVTLISDRTGEARQLATNDDGAFDFAAQRFEFSGRLTAEHQRCPDDFSRRR